MSQTFFKNNPRYKGAIVFFKENTGASFYAVKRRRIRGVGDQYYTISEAEFSYIINRHKAQKIWAYYHFGICGGIKHPLTGKTYYEQYKTRTKINFLLGIRNF